MSSPSRVLLVHGLRAEERSTIQHVVKSFAGFRDTHEVLFASFFGEGPDYSSRFDLMIVTAEALAMRSSSYWRIFEPRLLKWADQCTEVILLPQDEYTDSRRLEKLANKLNVSSVFGPCAEHYSRLLPNLDKATVVQSILPAYRSPFLSELSPRFRVPLEEREFDLVQRVSELGPQFGRIGKVKARYAVHIGELASSIGLRTDVSTNPKDVLAGENWFGFLANGRWTPTTKGGSSINDQTGLFATLANCQAASTSIGAEKLEQYLNRFDEVDQPYVADSPRIFEAASLGVGLVMPKGSYVGELLPDVDYLPVEFGASTADIDRIQKRMSDVGYLNEMTKSAHSKLIENVSLSQEFITSKILNSSSSDYQQTDSFVSITSDYSLSRLFMLKSGSRRMDIRDQILSRWSSARKSRKGFQLNGEDETIVDDWLEALGNGLPPESLAFKWAVPA